MKTYKQYNFKVFKSHRIEYIDSEEINEKFKEDGLFEKWCEFSQGQTGIIVDGVFGVYPCDVKQFLNGRPPLD